MNATATTFTIAEMLDAQRRIHQLVTETASMPFGFKVTWHGERVNIIDQDGTVSGANLGDVLEAEILHPYAVVGIEWSWVCDADPIVRWDLVG